jgi:hypothetical protein
MTALDVAHVITQIGPAYCRYENSFTSNGIDGLTLHFFSGQTDAQILLHLRDSNIQSGLHGLRILAELKKLWEPVAPSPLVAVNSIFVADMVSKIGDLYKQYEKAFVDNGFDGTMLSALVGISDPDVLKLLEIDLGIEKLLHRNRILMQLRDYHKSSVQPSS